MNDITDRWYEDTKKFLETKINSPNNLDTTTTSTTLQLTPRTSMTYATSTNELICDSHSTTSITKPYIADCGPTCLSDIVWEHKGFIFRSLKIKRIIFNPPATVVIWEDGTKTVVKCSEDDEFNPETGVAMCYMKKIYGSRHAFSKMVEKYITELAMRGDEE